MAYKYQIMKYASIILVFFLFSGCASTHNYSKKGRYYADAESGIKKNEYMVFIADIEWVKLFPNETLQEEYWENNAVKNADGILELLVSNGCGKAEIQYTTRNGERINTWMEMGEWCKNPFNHSLQTQVIVVDPNDNRLKEYYPVEQTLKENDVIFFLESYQFETSIFRDLVRPLDDPIYLFPTSEANAAWIEAMTDEGLIEDTGYEILALKGVYISDVINRYYDISAPTPNEIKTYFSKNRELFNQGDFAEGNDLPVKTIRPFSYADIFIHYQIYQVYTSGMYLEMVGLPDGGTSGFFATNGNDLYYLNQSNVANLERLLREEAVQIDKIEPDILCNFLAKIYLTHHTQYYNVVSSLSEIEEFTSYNSEWVLNLTEIDNIKNHISPPEISGDKTSGWKVEFCSWGGWMDYKREVSFHSFEISKDYKIKHSEKILSSNIFSKEPFIMY